MSLSTAEKALNINLNRPLYGTIAEIGAGQEVARWFFKVGGAAGTIAKAMSAYDKAFSDAIYGEEASGRYVVEHRLEKMLHHEFQLLEDRLVDPKLREKFFFAFANTVAAKSFKYQGDCHGWLGVRFQRHATEAPSQIILHVRMLDNTSLQQQEALGILGVNLIYGAFNYSDQRERFIQSLSEGNIDSRIEVNTIRFQGPAFENSSPIDDNLHLLFRGLTPSLYLCNDGQASPLSEELYNKQVICYRHDQTQQDSLCNSILLNAREDYCGNKTEGYCDPLLIHEIFIGDNQSSHTDIKKRVSTLLQNHQNVLVTNLARGYELSEHIGKFTNNHINLIFQAYQLNHIVEQLDVHSLEPLARVFNDSTRIFVHPNLSLQEGPNTLAEFTPPDDLKLLFQHLIQSRYIREIKRTMA